jgi:hypothetical protein
VLEPEKVLANEKQKKEALAKIETVKTVWLD